MNAVFKRKPAEPAPSWKDVDAYAAQGYACVQVDSFRVDEGHETPINGGGYGSVMHTGGEIRERDYGAEVGIISQKLPHQGISDTWARSTWLSVLRVSIAKDRKLVRDIENLIAPYLKWAPGVTTKHAPVRLTTGSSAILMPFRFESDHFCSPSARLRGFRLERDGRWDDPNYVSIATAYECFVASRYEWRGGDLREVHRLALPLMDQDRASAIIADVQRLLDERGVESAY